MDYILNMDVLDFIEFIRLAKEKEEQDRLRLQWNSFLPFMSMGMLKYMSFQEYEEKATGKNIDMRPADEIIKEIIDLHGGTLSEYF